MALTEHWWTEGIIKAGGTAVRYSQVEEIESDKLKITNLGSVFNYDFDNEKGDTGEKVKSLFITNNGTWIHYSHHLSEEPYPNFIYCNEPQEIAYKYSVWANIPQPNTLINLSELVGINQGSSVTAYAEKYNPETKKYEDKITFMNYRTNLFLTHVPRNTRVYGGLYKTPVKVVDIYKNCYPGITGMYGGISANDYAFSRSSSSGYGVKCTFYDNEITQALELRIIQDGFGTSQGSGLPNLIHEDTILGDIILTIPYSFLMNEDYFTDADGAEPIGDFEEDDSKQGGGGGVYGNYPEDEMDFPELPHVSALDSGFITAYNPTSSELQSLVNYLWTSDFIEVMKKMINNPMDAIVSLQMIPYSVRDLASTGVCKIGAVNTGINMDVLTDQYRILDCGNVYIPENWGNALDYMSTKISIYLPFIGVRNVDTDIFVNSTVSLKYYLDILSGVGIAMLKCSKSGSTSSVYYTYECNVNYQIPITGANYSEVIKGIIGLATTGIGMAVGGAGVGAAAIGGTIQNAANVIGNKTTIESSGNLASNTGILGGFTPYIIVDLPRQSLPNNFKHNKGFPSNITSKLSSLSGYTEVQYIHLDNIPATDEEKNEIMTLLKSGVII